MKNLIIEALDVAILKLDKATPATKKKEVLVDIINVEPTGLLQFMKENNIPDDAGFCGDENSSSVYLIYHVNVPSTDADKLTFKRDRFTSYAYHAVKDLLLNNGYKRTVFDSDSVKLFRDTTVYDMYINKEFDRLVTYYTASFKLQ